MLSRLEELREAAGASPEVDETAKPSSAVAPSEAELDGEWQDFIEEMKELYKEILEDDGVCVHDFEEVKDRVESMEEIVQLEKDALLPSKLAQLASRFESQELVAQRMIRRAKEMLATLKGEDEEYDEDDVALNALQPVRKSIARVRAMEFKELVYGFFEARSHNRQEMIARASRQLRYAYPDAAEEELNDIMEFPELAFVAISRRLEKGPEVTLDGILGEMEGKRADAQKLEQGAKELKLMFLQFEQLIDTQGDNLNAIEANIKTVIEETSDAITVLQEAEEQKRSYQGRMLKFYVLGLFLALCIVWKVVKTGKQTFKWFNKLPTTLYNELWMIDEKGSLSELAAQTSDLSAHTYMTPRKFYRHHDKGHGAGGVHRNMAPDSPHAPARGSSLAESSILRAVDLTARGGATTHSALRTARRAKHHENTPSK